MGGYAVTMRDQLVGDVKTSLYVLQIAVLVVLLIACANVANLLLMRATGRQRELAIRTAMGAGQRRLLRQLLTESVVLSFAGGIGGLALGLITIRVLLAMSTQQLSGMADASLHPVVLVSTLALSVLTGLVFGLVPAWSVARGTAGNLLKDEGTRASAGKRTGATRSALVIAEMALALLLLVTAGLLIKSFARLQRVNPGFSTENVLTAQLTLPASRYANPTARRAFWEQLLGKARALPGVTAVGLASNIPLSGNVSSGSYAIAGYTPGPTEAQPHGRQEVVGGDYFRAMQIPLIAGRAFNDSDAADTPSVVVIDEYLVKRYFANRNPLGQQIRRGGATNPPFTVVGVVGTINSIDLGQPVTKERLYYPVTQQPRPSMAVIVKTGLDPQQLVAPLRAAVQSLDPRTADRRRPDDGSVGGPLARKSPAADGPPGTVRGCGRSLAGVGLYGVLAFGVTQRWREFGIRQALGADAGAILRLVLTRGLRTATVGIAIGLAGALALTRFSQQSVVRRGGARRDGVRRRDVDVARRLDGGVCDTCPPGPRVDPAVALRDTY